MGFPENTRLNICKVINGISNQRRLKYPYGYQTQDQTPISIPLARISASNRTVAAMRTDGRTENTRLQLNQRAVRGAGHSFGATVDIELGEDAFSHVI